MGECGLRLGESKLYVQPGDYQRGFAAATLNGAPLASPSMAAAS